MADKQKSYNIKAPVLHNINSQLWPPSGKRLYAISAVYTY
jgi:hypothetical protein